MAIARTLAPDAEPFSTQVANQARILSTLGRYQESREKYEVVLAQARRHSYVEDQVSAPLGLARIAFLTDDLQRSQRLIDEASAARSPAGGVMEGGVVDKDLQITGQVWLALAKYQHQGGGHAEARVSVASALANLEATLNGDHRLIREGRELAAELAKAVTENSPTAVQTMQGR